MGIISKNMRDRWDEFDFVPKENQKQQPPIKQQYCCESKKTMFSSSIPSADVQPVKHGYWSECYTDSYHYSGICSVCGGGAIRKVKGKPLDYCPNCGARMDGDAE